MKSMIMMSVILVGSQAFAEGTQFLHCTIKGKNPHSIVKIDAAESNGEVVVNSTIQDSRGTNQILPTYKTRGSLASEFQVAADFYSGPFGIKQAYLVKKGDQYALESRTYCNFYYQEERCSDGDLIEKSTTTDLKCEN
jgi:hypothetical protein